MNKVAVFEGALPTRLSKMGLAKCVVVCTIYERIEGIQLLDELFLPPSVLPLAIYLLR
jgi:hypothetical protein